MRNDNKRSIVAVLILAGLPFAACGREAQVHEKVEPAHVAHIEGTELAHLTLTPKAMERIDVQTAFVTQAQVSRSSEPRKVVPYAAVLYDAAGRTWVYTRPEPHGFVRHEITVDYIEGNLAVLSEGPPVGTEVVTVGGAELFGTEFEVGH
ncbi:MAG: hypothetical protein PVI01_03970 [Gemmatimonadales bacterium]